MSAWRREKLAKFSHKKLSASWIWLRLSGDPNPVGKKPEEQKHSRIIVAKPKFLPFQPKNIRSILRYDLSNDVQKERNCHVRGKFW